MTLKEYASSSGISVQSATASFKRYREKGALTEGKHFTKVGKTVNLLPEGIEYLNEIRRKAPAIVPDADRMAEQEEELRKLKEELAEIKETAARNESEKAAEISELNLKLAETQAELSSTKDELIKVYRQVSELSGRLIEQKPSETEKAEKPLPERKTLWNRLFGR